MRRVAAVATALITGVASPLLLAPRASAATPQCHGYHCDGLGPVSQNCDDDASSVGSYTELSGWGPAKVQLEYSPGCNAYWARGHSLNTGSDGGTDSAGYTVRIQKRLISTGEVTYQNDEHISSNTEAYDWTLMAGSRSGRHVRACMYMSKAHSGSGTWHCTAWHN